MEYAEALALPKVAVIGVGSLGGAIVAGLRSPEVAIERPITVTTHSAQSRSRFDGAADVVAFAQELDASANRRAVESAKIVILAVKPWAIHDVISEIADHLARGTVLVSVAAGVTTASMEELVPAGVSVVRAMPNTPANVGLGVTGVAGGATASEADVALVARLFETVGKVVVVREEQINAIAAVSGSGPAYVYYFVEELTAAARRLGIDEAQAKVLAEQTVIGAAELMRGSAESPEQLRKNVTSPKGTTEQAITVLQEAGFDDIFDRALAANIRRSKELEAGE